MGLVYGDYGGRSDAFAPGGFSFENGFCPHGGTCRPRSRSCELPSLRTDTPSAVSYDEFKKATEAELQPMRVHEGTLGEPPPSSQTQTDQR